MLEILALNAKDETRHWPACLRRDGFAARRQLKVLP